MRISWFHLLGPIFVFLLFLAGSPVASAHSEHAHPESVAAAQSQPANAIGIHQVHGADARECTDGLPCNCPEKHRHRTGSCLAQCAGAVATAADDAIPQFFAARPVFTRMKTKSHAGWAPPFDPDPPRQIA